MRCAQMVHDFAIAESSQRPELVSSNRLLPPFLLQQWSLQVSSLPNMVSFSLLRSVGVRCPPPSLTIDLVDGTGTKRDRSTVKSARKTPCLWTSRTTYRRLLHMYVAAGMVTFPKICFFCFYLLPQEAFSFLLLLFASQNQLLPRKLSFLLLFASQKLCFASICFPELCFHFVSIIIVIIVCPVRTSSTRSRLV